MDKTPSSQAYKESGKPQPVVIFQKAAWQGGQSEPWKAAWLLTLWSSAGSQTPGATFVIYTTGHQMGCSISLQWGKVTMHVKGTAHLSLFINVSFLPSSCPLSKILGYSDSGVKPIYPQMKHILKLAKLEWNIGLHWSLWIDGANATKCLDILCNDGFFTEENGNWGVGRDKLIMNIYINHSLRVWFGVSPFRKSQK